MSSTSVRPLAGLATVLAIVAVIVFAITMFLGGFGQTVPVTVISERAGLVMNPEAKVQMRGVQVGQVESIETRPDGMAVLHLAMDPDELRNIPSNVLVDVSSSTVFGAKSVQLSEPPDPSPTPLAAGAQVSVEHVTVETNTVFQQLNSVLNAVDPVKLNQTLGAVSGALRGRGDKLGQTVTDLDRFLQNLNPSLENVSRDLEAAPVVVNAYADAAPDLVDVLANTTKVGDTIVDQAQAIDVFLLSSIGLAETGQDVLGTNRQALTDLLRMLVPTTAVASKYSDNLRCGVQGLAAFTKTPPFDNAGLNISATFTLGVDRYRYPSDLPKVAAKSGTSCTEQMLPVVPNGKRPPFLVTDVGANPWRFGNQGVLVNSDGLKQALFGPLEGPPRNTSQVGMPG
ncbi:MCE family protein [Mycobacterium sp. AT1]|uniref:MCE family protein n=1 Tax=Mycobacterium sp. AT1 TaxID=1961706 RepID=UPI0009ADCF5B|nr:MCE family protein [Mycobacterium sp. AT1]OPX12749.1 MCE-family protein [Mycobacterium sp. AT1]